MSYVVLLGAGASYDAGVPLAIPMAVEMQTVFEARRLHPHVTAAYDFVLRRLAEASNQAPNVEQVYQVLIDLAMRRHSVHAPFILAWDPRIEQFDPSDQIFASNPRGYTDSIFFDVAQCMRHALFDLTYISDPSRVDYYRPLAKAAAEARCPIVTLNYDNAVEAACKLEGIVPDLGLTQWANTGKTSFGADRLNLLKLHGSVLWGFNPDPHYGPHLFVDLTKVEPNLEYLDKWETMPYVVFGATNKLSNESFMLHLLLNFEERLRSAHTLIIVGYSFADAHINEIIARWLNHDRSLDIYDVMTEDQLSDALTRTAGGLQIAGHGDRRFLNTIRGGGAEWSESIAGTLCAAKGPKTRAFRAPT